MLILSHRGNIRGPGTIDYQECAKRGFGVEVDLRWEEAGWYFDHEPQGWWMFSDAETILGILQDSPMVAVNIKEQGKEREAVQFLKNPHWPPLFVFDMELARVDPTKYADIPRAARISDREKTPSFETPIIWLDEFEPWIQAGDIAALKRQGKTVHVVSPELHKPVRAPHEMGRLVERWKMFIRDGADGICTDHPIALAGIAEEQEAA